MTLNEEELFPTIFISRQKAIQLIIERMNGDILNEDLSRVLWNLGLENYEIKD